MLIFVKKTRPYMYENYTLLILTKLDKECEIKEIKEDLIKISNFNKTKIFKSYRKGINPFIKIKFDLDKIIKNYSNFYVEKIRTSAKFLKDKEEVSQLLSSYSTSETQFTKINNIEIKTRNFVLEKFPNHNQKIIYDYIIENYCENLKNYEDYQRRKNSNLFMRILVGGVIGLLFAPALGGMIGAGMGLSGAAATSAGLASLGGGSLAAGGFGMLGGSLFVGAMGSLTGLFLTSSTKTNQEYKIINTNIPLLGVEDGGIIKKKHLNVQKPHKLFCDGFSYFPYFGSFRPKYDFNNDIVYNINGHVMG